MHTRYRFYLPLALLLALTICMSACTPTTLIQTLETPSGQPGGIGTANPLGTVPRPVYLIGESLTAGRAATSEDMTWRRQVEAYMARDTNYNVFEQTTSTYSSGWKVANALKAATTTPPRKDAAVLFIGIGTNDISGNEGSTHITPTNVFVSTYAKLIVTVHAAAPAAHLFCFSVWWTSSPVTTIYDTAIQNDCQAAHGTYLNLQPIFDNPVYHGPAGTSEDWYKPGWKTDTFHPNDRAQTAIAQLIEKNLP